ncbi:MAG: ankyrin repeat domain-containing protein [Verrucomicrobiales bacterium]|nr:ankyrin repeat domain-containing protein [Verrucomicrobiales bacterium]
MKTLLLFVVLLLAAPAPRARAATGENLDQTFQAAILAEEARRDLSAAIRGYEEVVAKVDAQRTLAATAVFRLGECYRKIGRTNDAVGQYQRLIRDFPTEETLARLARENLVALGQLQLSPSAGKPANIADDGLTPPTGSEEAEIRRLRTLLDRSPDLLNAATPPDSKTPLILAAERGQLAVVQALIGWGAAVDRKANRGETALIAAARSGHKAIVEALLDAKADPQIATRDGTTALAAAVGRRYDVVVATLLSRGAKPGNEPEHSALFAAIESVQTNMIERLVQAGADVNGERPRSTIGVNSRPSTPLEAAVSLSLGNIAPVVRTLLRLGAIPTGTDQQNPLTIYYWGGAPDPGLLQELIQASPKENRPEGLLDRLLIDAVRNENKVGTLPVLLAGGASLNSPIVALETGSPLICLAAETATPRALEILLSAKPDLTVVNHDGQTALHIASIWGKVKNVELLLQAGADPNTLDPRDATPLTYVRQQIGHFSPTPQRSAPGALVAGAVPMPPPGTAMVARGNAPASLKDYQAAEALLLAHGAREDVVRRLQITAYRGTLQSRILRRSGDDPAPRLSDILLLAFAGNGWPWPQLNALRIDRLATGGKSETTLDIPPDWMNQQDCDWNIPLQWGDAIQIPEEDHVQGQGWAGLPDAASDSLLRCSSRRIKLVIKDETHQIELFPSQPSRRRNVGPPGMPVRIAAPVTNPGPGSPAIKAPDSLNVCQLWPVLEQSRVLRLSSDLTRVRVTRAATGQTWTLDAANDPRAQMFWLLDGDRIEVPEKQL